MCTLSLGCRVCLRWYEEATGSLMSTPLQQSQDGSLVTQSDQPPPEGPAKPASTEKQQYPLYTLVWPCRKLRQLLSQMS